MLALGQSLDCHSASEVSMFDMGTSVHVYPQQSTARQKPCGYFLGYTVDGNEQKRYRDKWYRQRGTWIDLSLNRTVACSLSVNLSSPDDTKWPPFRERHYQMHVHEWNVLNFDSDFILVSTQGSNWQYVSIGSGNGFNWTNAYLVHRRTRGRWVKHIRHLRMTSYPWVLATYSKCFTNAHLTLNNCMKWYIKFISVNNHAAWVSLCYQFMSN